MKSDMYNLNVITKPWKFSSSEDLYKMMYKRSFALLFYLFIKDMVSSKKDQF